jgi:isopentenyldiphosphate isomerase
MINHQKLSLIAQSDFCPLDIYAIQTLKFLEPESNNTKEKLKTRIKELQVKNKEIERLKILKRLSFLAEKNNLPRTIGHFNFNNFLSDVEGYKREDLLDGWAIESEEGEMYEVYKYKDTREEAVSQLVPMESVNIISPYQDSEVIIASNEVAEHYYVQYHDMAGSYLLSVGIETLLKAYLSFSLIDNDESFNLLLDMFERDSVESMPRTTVIRTMYELMMSPDLSTNTMNITEESEDRYLEMRES